MFQMHTLPKKCAHNFSLISPKLQSGNMVHHSSDNLYKAFSRLLINQVNINKAVPPEHKNKPYTSFLFIKTWSTFTTCNSSVQINVIVDPHIIRHLLDQYSIGNHSLQLGNNIG